MGRGDDCKFRAEELCESRGGRCGLPVPSSPYGLCGRKATLNLNSDTQSSGAVRKSRWTSWTGVPNSLYGLCGRKVTLNLNSDLRSYEEVEAPRPY